MKIRTFISTALLAAAPMIAGADDAASIQRCMDAFAERSFPNASVTYVVKDDRFTASPLVARTGTYRVELVASSKNTGRVLATATCKVKLDAKGGKVIVLPFIT